MCLWSRDSFLKIDRRPEENHGDTYQTWNEPEREEPRRSSTLADRIKAEKKVTDDLKKDKRKVQQAISEVTHDIDHMKAMLGIE